MQPWTEKASTSNNKSSLHFDNTLSQLNHVSSTHQTNTFRTKGKEVHHDSIVKEELSSPISLFSNHASNFQVAPHENALDGSDVLNFLNTTNYSDSVHHDDLVPDSISYISHRHQMDTQHALSEREKHQHHWTAELLAAEDIVDYLQKADYTEDIYGIPHLGQWIKEAKEELAQSSTKRTAVERLTMIRHHLVQKALGDPELAAKNALGMNEHDWSSTFLDSAK
ncbi:uncharacterized protein B0P05DRAFT_521651 [Gilbertella persicaria]|uniref:Uncharacterized protein n=1 Tax=Rhizopus stolonifer TaxID=4846 RepID=A0A367JZY7_RHIST|nr:uncharacterized protein B0P05DRAFT_521651 [Gilbertella persicaria]KAI8098367.1 hypothetical protein B0P05DRAFT_521651 [Gilbertella persicaria]RCH95524.1 hypothetical protein CU098_011164 [Rhizopus stolonifer]